jgi:DNA polymerase delta subunit 1
MSLMRYHPDSERLTKKYIKIEALSQAYIPKLRRLFERGEKILNYYLPMETFESNIPYILRFMIDKEIVGMGWFRVNPGYTIVDKKMTMCQLEISASVDLL